MKFLSLTCAESARLLSDAHESPLPLTARTGLRLHLALCRQCRRYRRQLELIHAALAGFPTHIEEKRLSVEARHRIIPRLGGLV